MKLYITKLLLLLSLMVALYQTASAGIKDDFVHEPSSAKGAQAKHVAEPDDGYDVSSFSPEQQAWEQLLK